VSDKPLLGLSEEADPVASLFGLDAVFPTVPADDQALRAQVTDWLGAFKRHGVAATLAALR
jgi:hypothetical protein